MALSACVTLAAGRHAQDRVSTAAAAEAALQECSAEDRALAAVLSAEQMTAARDRNRQRAFRNVAIARGEQAAPAPTPVAAWGACIGGRVSSLLAGNGDVQAIATTALDACRAEEQSARADIARQLGPERADAEIRSMRANVPMLVQRAIAARGQ